MKDIFKSQVKGHAKDFVGNTVKDKILNPNERDKKGFPNHKPNFFDPKKSLENEINNHNKQKLFSSYMKK